MLPIPIDTWYQYVDVLTIKGTKDTPQNHQNSTDPCIKFTVETSNEQGAIPFFDTFHRPSGNKIITSVCRKPTHMDGYLNFNSNCPMSAKCAVVRALTVRRKNVCSTPELLAEEMDYLDKVLRYNNYPQWMMYKNSRSDSLGEPLVDPETSNEVKKSKFVFEKL